MTTAAQLLLSVVICVLTFLITFAAIQTFHLIHELRVAVKKLNQILDKPVSVSTLAQDMSLRQILQVPENHPPASEQADRVIESQPSLHRFFHKSGTPLRS